MPPRLILYAEDDPDDVHIFKRSLGRSDLSHRLHIVDDGQAAIDWLKGEHEYADRHSYPLPDLLILDLKMPRRTGFDVLEWVRSNSEFKTLPVLIMSSSDDPADVHRALALGATTYIVKSPHNKEVIEVLRAF